jgi:hypothetical protein
VSDEDYRRALLQEIATQARLVSHAKREGREVSLSPADFPACSELIRFAVSALHGRANWKPDMQIQYRGAKAICSFTTFGRLLLTAPDGRTIGASGFGALWED